MKEKYINDIINCPVCDSTPILRCNASKLFQVRCPDCGAHTSWKRKIDAVVMWYNMVIQYHKNAQKLTKQE